MTPATEIFQLWVPVSVVAAALIVGRHWNDHQAGLLFTYVASFASIYILGPAMHLMPDYYSPGAQDTAEGLRVSTMALIAFGIGAEFASRWLRSRRVRQDVEARELVDTRLVNIYLVAGVVLYFFIMPMVGGIATLRTLVATASSLAVIGFCLHCWNAWVREKPARLWFLLTATLVFPLATVIGQGFLGYGLACTATVLAFAASFYRPRWRVVIAGAVMTWCILSVYVTYMRDRKVIRESVWAGESFDRRMDRMTQTLSSLEAFNVGNPDHLARIEDRLNQNALLGVAIRYVGAGLVPFARGETFVAAAIAPIPRVIWPDKPSVAGSGDLVAYYTGLSFQGETSVGVGHVLEAYINFGTYGVWVAFIALGALFVFIDSTAYRHLHAGNGHSFVLWYLPGLGLLQVGGSLSEATGFAAASWLVARAINAIAGHKRRVKGEGGDMVAESLPSPASSEGRGRL